MIYDLHLSFRLFKLTLTLFKLKKAIINATSKLRSVSRKVSLKEAEISVFVIDIKQSNVYPISFRPIAVNFLSTHFSFANVVAWFLCKFLLHYVNFAI